MTYGEVDIQLRIFLTSASYEDEWSASYFGRFIRGHRALTISVSISWDVAWTPEPVYRQWDLTTSALLD
jgi:hypothetical protein